MGQGTFQAAIPTTAAVALANPTADQTYTVVRGDNLKRIAHQYHTTLSQLVGLNERRYPSLLRNPYAVRAGWVLRLRGTQSGAGDSGQVAGRSYTVGRGDDLRGIAERLHTTVAQLIEINKSHYPSLETSPRVIPGWVLRAD